MIMAIITIHPKFTNVTFLGNATDLFSFYGDISLLLVPSIIAEGYPRV